MKTIGLLGGLGWVSTIEYYRNLNQKVNKTLGKHHSAKIILNSIDHESVRQFDYNEWDKIAEILKEGILQLDSFGADCILICNNTLHKAFDLISSSLNTKAPVFHIVDCVGEYAVQQNLNKLLLLGTKFTMEDGFYHNRLKNFGLEVITLDESDRLEVNRVIQEELLKNIFKDGSKKWFQDMIKKYDCDAVTLGCTELPLLIKQEDYKTPILSSVELHCQKAVDFALK